MLRAEESDLQSRLKKSHEETSTLSSHRHVERRAIDSDQLDDTSREHAGTRKADGEVVEQAKLASEKRDNAKRKIGELGSLPEKEVKEYRSVDVVS